MTAGALSREQPGSIPCWRTDHLSSPVVVENKSVRYGAQMAFLLSLHFIAHFDRQNRKKEDGKSLSFDPCISKTQLKLELVSTLPGLQGFNKRAVFKQIRTKRKKKGETIHASLAFFIPERKKTWDHIRQENNAHSL